MKKVKKSMRRTGCKALATVMIATSLVNMAAPAFAKDDVIPTQTIVTEEQEPATSESTEVTTSESTGTSTESTTSESTGTSTEATTSESTGTNTENNPTESIGTDTENDVNDEGNNDQNANKADDQDKPEEFTNKEIEDAKKKAEEEKKKEEEFEKAKTELEKKGLNELGTKLGPALADLFKGKYESASDAVSKIGIATLDGLNEGFVKNIPYGGGFAYSLIKALSSNSTEKTDQQKMEAILQRINDTINSCTNVLIKKASVSGEDQYIKDINDAITKLQAQYTQNNTDLSTALKYKYASEDPEEYENVLEQFYSSNYTKDAKKTNPYLAAFMRFGTLALGGQVVQGSSENGGGRNVYELTDSVDMDGKKHIMESYDQRVALVANLKNIFADGNSALSLAMKADQEKVDTVLNVCKYKKGLLWKQMKDMPESEEKVKLKGEYNEYRKLEIEYQKRKERVEQDLKALDEMAKNFDTATTNQESNINADKKNFEEFENDTSKETLTIGGTQLETITVKKTIRQKDGSVKTEEVKAYPTYNAKDDVIEYKDKYGYVCAKKERTTEILEDVDIHTIKPGQKYILRKEYDTMLFGENKGEITIDKVYEDQVPLTRFVNWISRFLGNPTHFTRTMIDYTDSKGIKHTGFNISSQSNYTLARFKLRDDLKYESGYEANIK